jgi:predicted transport protein
MGEIKLFRLKGKQPLELPARNVDLEKSLQTLIERNLETFLGVRFVASEHSTGKNHPGRIDTLGLDENGRPVIIEYKRNRSENVINQGLFYLDWLVDHRGDFADLVEKKIGKAARDEIDWSAPRLICIAADFTRYDEHAILQMGRNIELLRYKTYGDGLHLFEQVNSVQAGKQAQGEGRRSPKTVQKTVDVQVEGAPDDLKDLFFEIDTHLRSLGDDVQPTATKFYFAYKRIRNFACVEVRPKLKHVLVFVNVDPSSVALKEGFTRNVKKIGHYGTGDLEITIRSTDDLERAKPLLLRSYEA